MVERARGERAARESQRSFSGIAISFPVSELRARGDARRRRKRDIRGRTTRLVVDECARGTGEVEGSVTRARQSVGNKL